VSQQRKNIDKEVKAKVALEAIRNEKTVSQITSQFEVQSGQISTRKRKLVSTAPDVFEDKKSKEFRKKDAEKREHDYHLQI
jgi:putative transposase